MNKEGLSFDAIQKANLDKLYRRNPEWQALKGRENRFNEVIKSDVIEEKIFSHEGKLIGMNLTFTRPEIFPYETGEGVKA